jgi:hypothetical protein
MQSLADHLEHHANRLGVEFEKISEIEIEPGVTVRPKFLFRHFGGPSGMLVFTNFTEVKDSSDSLAIAGYGVAILGDPVRETTGDEQAFIAMLVDWGWSGEASEAPSWIR